MQRVDLNKVRNDINMLEFKREGIRDDLYDWYRVHRDGDITDSEYEYHRRQLITKRNEVDYHITILKEYCKTV